MPLLTFWFIKREDFYKAIIRMSAVLNLQTEALKNLQQATESTANSFAQLGKALEKRKNAKI